MSGEPLAAGASTARSPPASGIETTDAEACAVEADWCDAGALMRITVPRRVNRSMILYRLACAAVVLRCFESAPLRSCTFRIHCASPKRHERTRRSFLQKARKLDVAYAAYLRGIVPQRASTRKPNRTQRPVCASGIERSGRCAQAEPNAATGVRKRDRTQRVDMRAKPKRFKPLSALLRTRDNRAFYQHRR